MRTYLLVDGEKLELEDLYALQELTRFYLEERLITLERDGKKDQRKIANIDLSLVQSGRGFDAIQTIEIE